jgi:hydrogenase maturation protease
MASRILVAGIGNIFLGDDAFGCEAVWRLATRNLPQSVQVMDFGIRGLDLTFALLQDYKAFILVDAVPRGGPPGTLYKIEVDMSTVEGAGSAELHAMNPMQVLAAVKAMGGNPRRVFVVGCEPSPSPSGEDAEYMGLSEPVQAALDGAAAMIASLIFELMGEGGREHEHVLESAGGGSSGGGAGGSRP